MGLAKPVWPVLQRESTLAQGLVGAWPFHEGAGNTLNDLSGNRANGTLQAAPPWVGGPFGSALSFNGSSQYADLGPAPSLKIGTSQPFTVSCWVFPTSTSIQGGVVSNGLTGNNINWEIRAYLNSTTWDIFSYDGSTYNAATFVPPPLNVWTHIVAGSYGGASSWFVWFNSIPATVTGGSGTAGANGSVSGHGYIGFEAGSTRFFQGKVDGVAVWNRSLSRSEIAQLYFDPFALYRRSSRRWRTASITTGPLIHWDAAALGTGITLTNSQLTATRN